LEVKGNKKYPKDSARVAGYLVRIFFAFMDANRFLT